VPALALVALLGTPAARAHELGTIQVRATFEAGGRYRVDVTVEGVSLVSNFRSQFQDIITNGGPDRLLTLLKEKNASGESLVQPTPA